MRLSKDIYVLTNAGLEVIPQDLDDQPVLGENNELFGFRRSAKRALKDAASVAAGRMHTAGGWSKTHARLMLILGIVLLTSTVGAVVYWELSTSGIEASYVTSIAPELTYRVENGPSASALFPKEGPYDLELGYAQIPHMTQRLTQAGYEVTSQARLSPLHQTLATAGLYPAYQEKSQHGLTILGAEDQTVFAERFPKVGYQTLDDVPPLVVATLLFIEDRQVLDQNHSETLNPAVQWDRLTKASLDLVLDKIFRDRNVPGGSTLATQLEKFRHSEGGRTHNTHDKLRQMASATARAYLLGRDTRAMREQIVLDYINGVPLGAVPGFGQVTGLGEGLKGWYGVDLEALNTALNWKAQTADRPARIRLATAFKQVLSLFLSQRRPAFYLQQDQDALAELANNHLALMAKAGVISEELANDARQVKLAPLSADQPRAKAAPVSFIDRKAANAVRVELQRLLNVKSLYELDRMDAEVKSSFDPALQEGVTKFLEGLQTPEGAVTAGMIGERMLRPEQAPLVNYSLTLIERQDDHNVVRVQTDTVNAPLDLNRGGKLELGSTAKLRTLLTYLEMVGEIYAAYQPHADDEAYMKAAIAKTSSEDTMTLWALGYLKDAGSTATLQETLTAAADRPFSASPAQAFATGGGIMHFQNFEKEDNGSKFTVAQGFQRSNNLVFVRVMQEVVQHTIFSKIPQAADLLADEEHPLRSVYLDRFEEMESGQYLARFYSILAPLSPADRLSRLKTTKHLTTSRLGALALSLDPSLDLLAFHAVMHQTFPDLKENVILRYWKTMRPSVMSAADRAYVARIHPIAMWLAIYLNEHPGATLAMAMNESKEARRESYTWLYKKAGPKRQERDIRTMLEREAFSKHIITYWKRQGFPFEQMTPSYASALGSSGDRPSALADLMGAVFNHGVITPTTRIDEIRFGRSTPYETVFAPAWMGARRAASPEAANVARAALLSVVDGGTARRLKGSLKRDDGTEVPIAGKTGTGDNRMIVFGPGGKMLRSDAKSRTATLVFAIGEHYYGTITAYVKADQGDAQVADFHFTSSLVVQALKALMPTLKPAVLKSEDDPWTFVVN